MNKERYDHAFNEKIANKNIFEYNELTSATINWCFRNTSLVEPIRCVIKHLLYGDILDENIINNPSEIEKIVQKWYVVSLYKFISSIADTKKINDSNLKVFDKKITIDEILKLEECKINLFNNLLNNRNYDESKLKNDLKELKLNKTTIDKIVKDNRIIYKYFYKGLKLMYMSHTNNREARVDILICDCINNDNQLDNFDFEITDDEMDNFKLNFKKELKSVGRNKCIIFMGHMINSIIKSSNLKKDDYHYKRTGINLRILDKDFKSTDYFNFLEPLNNIDEYTKVKILYEKVYPFKFKYNNINYELTNTGIYKI